MTEVRRGCPPTQLAFGRSYREQGKTAMLGVHVTRGRSEMQTHGAIHQRKGMPGARMQNVSLLSDRR